MWKREKERCTVGVSCVMDTQIVSRALSEHEPHDIVGKSGVVSKQSYVANDFDPPRSTIRVTSCRELDNLEYART